MSKPHVSMKEAMIRMGNNKADVQLQAFYHQQFHILWWAQFLCRNEEKIVVSPDRWYNIPEWSNSLIESVFIKIPS